MRAFIIGTFAVTALSFFATTASAFRQLEDFHGARKSSSRHSRAAIALTSACMRVQK